MECVRSPKLTGSVWTFIPKYVKRETAAQSAYTQYYRTYEPSPSQSSPSAPTRRAAASQQRRPV